KLRRSRKQAVVAAAGRGGDAVRHFALHQYDNAFKIFRVLEKPQQNVRRDVVGKVADHFYRGWLEFYAGAAQTGLGAEKGVEVHREYVSLDDFHVAGHAKLPDKLRRQNPV